MILLVSVASILSLLRGAAGGPPPAGRVVTRYSGGPARIGPAPVFHASRPHSEGSAPIEPGAVVPPPPPPPARPARLDAVRPLVPRLETNPAIRRPATRVGPYRVLVEQVTASEYLQELLGVTPGAQPATTGRRSAHVQLRLLADNPEAAAAVELFAIHAVTVGSEGRGADVAHYGGPLENADDAVLRAYVYAGDVGMATREINSVEGEVVAFEHAEEVRAELPLDPGASVVVGGARFTLSECAKRDGMFVIRLVGRPPAGGQLLAATLDGTYGIDLVTDAGDHAAPAGSTLGTTSEGDAEFDLAFQAPRGSPRRLRIRALLRSGARHAYPFRVQHVPLPQTPDAGTR